MQPDLTLELLKIIPVEKLDFDILSTHGELTLEWLEEFPNAPWNSKNLSCHSNFEIEWVDKFLNSSGVLIVRVIPINPPTVIKCLG